MNEKRALTRWARLVDSENEYGVKGYRSVWGGFHMCSEPYTYWVWFKLILLHPGAWRTGLHYIRDTWRHRRCDTVDFHHYACTLDPCGKKMDDDYRWEKTWRTDS